MSYRVFVDGHEGTTGLRIHEYLAQRSDIDVLRIDAEQRKNPAERARLLNAADVAFLCLPDAASREAAAMVENQTTCLIDASTAHRISPGWVFGLPELAPEQRSMLRTSKRIANPGCHASAFILAIRPLVDAGLIPDQTTLSATSITGYSGGGKKLIEQYEHGGDQSLDAPRPYGLGLAHKHIPEMTAHARLSKAPIFMPIVGRFYKGLATAIPLALSDLKLGTSGKILQQTLADRYAGERFVRVMPLSDPATLEQGSFDVQACNDTNRVDIFVFANEQQAIVITRLDNLGKGASGAAVQSMNVHLGIEEGTGL